MISDLLSINVLQWVHFVRSDQTRVAVPTMQIDYWYNNKMWGNTHMNKLKNNNRLICYSFKPMNVGAAIQHKLLTFITWITICIKITLFFLWYTDGILFALLAFHQESLSLHTPLLCHTFYRLLHNLLSLDGPGPALTPSRIQKKVMDLMSIIDYKALGDTTSVLEHFGGTSTSVIVTRSS